MVYFLKSEGNSSLFTGLCRMIQQQRLLVFAILLVLTHSKQPFQVTTDGVEDHRHLDPDQSTDFDPVESRSLHGTNGSLNRRPQILLFPKGLCLHVFPSFIAFIAFECNVDFHALLLFLGKTWVRIGTPFTILM